MPPKFELTFTEFAKLGNRISELEAQRDTLFSAIAHGDQEHRAWLAQAIAGHFDGKPVEQPRGMGATEAQLATARNDALEEAARVLDGMATDKGDDYAACIRALKGGE